MKRGNVIRYALIPLAAVLVFWWGGYLYFKGSGDWLEIQALLSTDPAIRAKVGEVKTMSIAPMPFMYRFSGDHAKATLRVTVIGNRGEHRATIEAERRSGRWELLH